MKILIIFILVSVNLVCGENEPEDVLSVNVDGLLMNEADITASSTCGMNGPEKYCRLVDEAQMMMYSGQDPNILCDICDDSNNTKRHPIEYAKSDDQNLWWQSPSMAQGPDFQRVNITIDLKQVYQIVYILLKMAESPRPGTWILEKSLDGVEYSPWIFFADTPYACVNLFQRQYPKIQLTIHAKPPSLEDDEVFCTTYYSQPNSLIAGEIIISLINGRKSLLMHNERAPRSIPLKLINFLSARYIRFRFLKPLTLAADLMTYKGHLEKSIYNRYFYSLRNVEVGGKCICNNHADKCDKVIKDGIAVSKCNCKHNTCGNNCEKCCDMFNQKPWRQRIPCEECNCNGKSSKCVYNQTVATHQLSVNKLGKVDGGGMCLDCRENTAGINCEKCKTGFYRPWNVYATSSFPCRACNCNGIGTVGSCVSNGEEVDNQKSGDCICKKGYKGQHCDECDIGYERYPNQECLACPCSIDGSVSSSLYQCKPPCNCKVNVEVSRNCDTCKKSFFNLDRNNEEGCQPCYCFGITDRCSSLNAANLQIQNLRNWKITTLSMDKVTDPLTSQLNYPSVENTLVDSILKNPSVYYWMAPKIYLGSWLTSYKSFLQYIIKVETEGSSIGSLIDSPDVIIKCGTIKMFHSVSTDDQRSHRNVLIPLKEQYWKLYTSVGATRFLSKDEFMSCLVNIQTMLIKGKYFTNQLSVGLLNVTLDHGEEQSALSNMLHIEKCECPIGYKGLSCESCQVGYRRVNNILAQGLCEPCNCYQHSKICDPFTGDCMNCSNNTTGSNCDTCSVGYYGNPRSGDIDACKKCACPLYDYQLTTTCSTFEPSKYICHDCTEKTGGAHCQRCIEGYYGNPLKKVPCRKCNCNDNEESCDNITGQCRCSFNTMGAQCELCIHGFFGEAISKNCQKCDCSSFGSINPFCNKSNGQCACKTDFSGRTCHKCIPGFYLNKETCVPCSCNKMGRIKADEYCDFLTGTCFCKEGISGTMCDRCLPGFYGFPNCKECKCSNHSISSDCDLKDGRCKCGTNVLDNKCENCLDLFYWSNATHCSPCKCGLGSTKQSCDMDSGNCECAPHVIGRSCEQCEFNYYGLSPSGCKKCPDCLNGKVCNNDGQCVCPSNTEGEFCERCADQSWGYSKLLGCKKCNCFKDGSISSTCDIANGQCICRPQFRGLNCDKCAIDFYGFPDCRPCGCNRDGVLPNQVNMCHPTNGSCLCKMNVEGEMCNRCKNGTFGFDENYEGGCYSCFCSGRSSKCSILTDYRLISNGEKTYHIYNDIQIPLPEKDTETIKLSLKTPSRFGWPLSLIRPVFIDITDFLTTPDLSFLYRRIMFTVDIDCQSVTCGKLNSQQTEVILESFGGTMELNYIVNHSQIVRSKLIVEVSETSKHGRWFLTKYNNESLPQRINLDYKKYLNLARDVFVMALMNVNKVKVQLYSDKVNPEEVKITLETFIPINTNENIGKKIISVEKCDCDALTTGLHCENPIQGYYKKSISNPEVFFNITVRVGHRINVNIEKCFCNGHSKECNKITGHCINCKNNTVGPRCEFCAAEYYENLGNNKQCDKCECPSSTYNFANKCNRTSNSFICDCKEGYVGNLCERCHQGFFGNPTKGVNCKLCQCNPDGSLSSTCDDSGKCYCAPGIEGEKCDQCSANHVVENKKCKDCSTGCTKELFLRIDKLNDTVLNLKWKSLPSQEETALQQINSTINFIKKNISDINLVYIFGQQLEEIFTEFMKRKESILNRYKNAVIVRDAYNETSKKIFEIVKDIEDTIKGGKHTQVSKEVITNATNILKEIQERKSNMPNIAAVENELLLIQNHIDNINQKRKMIQSRMHFNQSANVKDLILKTTLAEKINENNKFYVRNLTTETADYETKIKDYQTKIILKEEEYKRIMQKKGSLSGQIVELKQIANEFEKKINMTFTLDSEIKRLLKNLWNEIPATKQLVIPDTVKEIVNKLVEKSKDLIKNLLKSFDILNRAEDAKGAYTNISNNIQEVEEAIKSTDKQLEDSKKQLQIDAFSTNINDIDQNHTAILVLKSIEENNFQKLSEEYNVLKNKSKFIEKENLNKSSQLPKQTYKNTVKEFNLNISIIENKQDVNQKTIDNLSQSLSNFIIPKSGSVDITDIEYKVSDLKEQYKGIKNETQSVIISIKELRENLKKLRERLRKRNIYTELAHGAAAKSPEPIRLAKSCVRHYKTYFLPKSNAFYLELYLNPQFHTEQNLILFGYDNTGGNNKSFALTIEKNKQVKFWYDYGTGLHELNVDSSIFTPSNYTGISISWNLGKWEMKHKSLEGYSKFGTFSTNKSSINNIFLGPDTHIFLGGYPSDSLLMKSNLKLGGQLVKYLKETYSTKHYKGCIYGVKLLHFDLGLQDFHNVEEECFNSNYAFFLLKKDFTCKISISNTDFVESTRKVIRRQRRNTFRDYNIHFNGHGYIMINTSEVEGNGAKCTKQLNKALRIYTFPQPKINQQSLQLVTVFVNEKLNIGFVIAQKNGKFHHGYWKGNEDFLLKEMNTKGDFIAWQIFNKENEFIFGINEVCDPYSFMYLGGIPSSEVTLKERLIRLKVPYHSYTGSMKINVVDKELFRKSSTRFVSKNLKSEKEISIFPFHSLYVPASLQDPILLDHEKYENVLKHGFSFNVDFLGSPITEDLALLSIESTETRLTLKMSTDREFTVLLNDQKLALKNFDVDDKWGTYFVVVNFHLKSNVTEVSITVNEPTLMMKELPVKIDTKVTKIEIGQTSFPRSFYIYDILLGERLVDFSAIRMAELPINAYLKLSPSHLRPLDSSSTFPERQKTDLRVSSRHGEILQSDAVALPYINNGHLYISSNRATKNSLSSFQSEDYPLDSGWFDGQEGSMLTLNGAVFNNYLNASGNTISFRLSSDSSRPEMILSINFGPSKTLNIVTLDRQVMLYDSLSKWNSTLRVEVVNKEWHVIELTSSTPPDGGLLIHINKHSFNFPNGPFSFTKPNHIEIGGFTGARPNIYYNGRYYEVGMFTGCLDNLKMNDKKISLRMGSSTSNIGQCARVLEFLDKGMEIKQSYASVSTSSDIVKLNIGNYAVTENRNSLVVEFRFKYTGFEQGALIVSGDNTRFCAVVINDGKLYLNCMNFKNSNKKSENLKLKAIKWYKVDFLIFHLPNAITVFKVNVDDQVLQVHFSGIDAFSTEFIKPDLYIGGHPGLSLSQKESLAGTSKSFVGCLSGFNVRVYDTYVSSSVGHSQHIVPGRCSIDKYTYLRKL